MAMDNGLSIGDALALTKNNDDNGGFLSGGAGGILALIIVFILLFGGGSAWDEFVSYKTYKEQYKRTRQDDDLQMAHDELGHFLNNVNDVYRELAKICQDDMEECSMVKAKVKEVYQMFH